MDDLKYVTYCGLYCGLCANIARIPQQASALKNTLINDGWEYFGKYVIENFDEFFKALDKFSQFDKTCAGCRNGCGNPDCEIRKCAQDKKVELCPSCDQYPCTHIENLAKSYPNLIGDGTRLKQIGIEKWVEEQKKRQQNGFCYADIRCPS